MKPASEWCDIRRSGASEYVNERPECNCKLVEAVRAELRQELAAELRKLDTSWAWDRIKRLYLDDVLTVVETFGAEKEQGK